MIYGITKQILDALSPFLSEEDVEITAEKHILDDGSAPEYGDKVILDKENNVWFEVFENEIVLFYFTDHEHFDDYMERPRDGEGLSNPRRWRFDSVRDGRTASCAIAGSGRPEEHPGVSLSVAPRNRLLRVLCRRDAERRDGCHLRGRRCGDFAPHVREG